MKGRVIRSTGSWCTVAGEDGQKTECKLKGNFRIRGITSTNPLAVGDIVDYELQADEEIGIINTIRERNNYIIRKSTKLSRQSHILAANIDQLILIATLALPRTSTGFIDRFLVTSEAYHIQAFIVFNKLDLFENEMMEELQEMMDIYKGAGYGVLTASAYNGSGMQEIEELLKNKVSLMAGHSGVGKSSLINRLEPGLNIKTKEISRAHLKGQHATTFAEMHELSFGGFVIDTPGIKEFGLINFEKSEVGERFPEMRRYMHDCRYHNCTHTHEPGCAVKKALEEGLIHPSRYYNYLSILNDKDWNDGIRD